MNGDDVAPPLKRRRTSQDEDEEEEYSPRMSPIERPLPLRTDTDQSREGQQNHRREYSSSRSRNESVDKDYQNTSGEGYGRREHSRDLESSSRSRSRRRYRSYSSERHGEKEDQEKSRLSFNLLATLPRAHARGITTVKFSPDQTLLATGSADATINIYSVPSNPTKDTPFKLLRSLQAHLAGVNALSWSPVGPPYTLASASDDKSILLWSPLSSDFPISPSPLTGHSNYVYSLAFSPKGNMLVSGSYDEAVFLWDVRSANIMRSLPAHSDPVSGVDFIRDGSMVCSCASDGLIRIWDSGTGQCLKTLVDEDRKAVTAVRFTPNGKFVLAWTLDGCVRLWRFMNSDGACVKTYQGHVNKEYSLSGAVGDYGVIDEKTGMESRHAFVISGSEDGDLVCWDVSSKDILWRGKGHRDVVLAVDYARAKDGRGLLASVGKDRDLRIWIEDVETNEDGNDEGKEDAIGARQMDVEVAGTRLEVKREDTEMEGV